MIVENNTRAIWAPRAVIIALTSAFSPRIEVSIWVSKHCKSLACFVLLHTHDHQQVTGNVQCYASLHPSPHLRDHVDRHEQGVKHIYIPQETMNERKRHRFYPIHPRNLCRQWFFHCDDLPYSTTRSSERRIGDIERFSPSRRCRICLDLVLVTHRERRI